MTVSSLFPCAKRRFMPRANTMRAILCAASLMVSGHALADAPAEALTEATKLLKQGQQAQALDQIDKFLASKPKDAQGRFLKGLILTEMNKTQDAIAIFQRLTEDYPELPEPYNNLAVIYAQQKQYEKSKQALEMAIRTHPSYATAHENLGDIYTRMASQAYDKALQIDSSNTSAQTKLSMIRELMGNGGRAPASSSKPPVVVAAADTKKLTETKVENVKAPDTKPIEIKSEIKPEITKPIDIKADIKTDSTRPIDVKVELPKMTVAQANLSSSGKQTETKSADATDDINNMVEKWAKAWSNKDVKGYLSHYAASFKTPDGESRSKWEAERTARITKPGAINVDVESLRVTMDGNDKATVKFRQNYKSANLKSSSGKTLVMVRQDGKWLIQQERVGN